MRPMKLFGFVLLSVCALAIVGAVGVAGYGAHADWAKADVMKGMAGLLIVAEVTFWTGGGILGLSIIQRRRAGLARFFGRLAFWRRRSPNDAIDLG